MLKATGHHLSGMIFLFVIFTFPALHGSDVLQGDDCFTVPWDGGSYYDFANDPIPAGFFGPGSDPFDGIILLGGQQVDTDPPEVLGPTNAIIRRLETASFISCEIGDVIPVEIVSLNLVSVNPIRITFFGGTIPTFWDVDVCLSISQQQQGTMTITHSCDAGGIFNTNLWVLPKFRFTKTDEPEFQEILDFGIEHRSAPLLESGLVEWTHSDHGLNLISSPGGITVDHNCDGIIDKTVEPGSNFFGGVVGSPCDCDNEPVGFDVQLFNLQSGDQAMRIGLIPAQGQGQEQVPTLSEWGMLIVGLLLLALGTVAVIRRKEAILSRIP